MADFKITPDDAIFVSLGTAAQGITAWFMRGQKPNWFMAVPTVAAVAMVGIGGGYVGMTKETVPRALAAFAIGFGMSQVISYLLPKVTGGETPSAGQVSPT